jgi:hypothetical protein
LNKLDRRVACFAENLDVGELNFPEVIHKFRIMEKEKRQKHICESRETHLRAKRRIGESVEYIKYRKCLYIDTIREWREEMSSALSPPVLDEMQQLLTRLFR